MKKFVLSLLVLLAWAGSSQAQYTLPFTETFESTSVLPADWFSWQSAGQGSYWAADFGMTGGCAFSWYDGTIWLISKAITVPAGGSVDISYYQKNTFPESYVKHGLYYSTTGEWFVGEWTAINDNLGAGDWDWTLSPTYTLTGYAGTTVYIAWKYEGSFADGWYVDNFHMEVTPQCLTPVGVNATEITVSSATLRWTAPSPAPSNGYDIYYSTSSTPPISSTVPTATVGAGITTYSMVSLSANTVYYAWVRSNCGGSSSSWTNVYSFKTLCNAVTVLPFNEGFESGYTDQTTVGGCWTQFGGAWGVYWTANSSGTTYNRGPRTGSWDATLYMYGDTWMYRKFTLTGGMYYTVSCWAQQDGSTPSMATIELKYGTVDTPGGMTGAIQSPTGLTTSYTQISGSFAPATTGDYYIGIHGVHSSYPPPYYITLDDIQVSETYSCFPPTAIAATAIGQTSASIAWTPPASAPSGGYDIYYSTSSTPPTSGTTPSGSVAAGVTAYTMTPLTLGTTYYVWVRSNCGSGTVSLWSTVFSFSTHGTVPTAITVPGTYPNLTGVGGAFEAINCGVLSGNTTISITADLTEPGTIALNGWTENPSGSNYTLLIQPDASTLRTISGTLTYSASTPALIRTNGASRVTIDGQAGKYLTFRNTTATPSGAAGTILFNNSSQNCYLKNSTLEGNYSSSSYGTVTIGNTGNNSVELSGNDVRDATAGTTGGIPGVGIYCASQTSSLSVLNNNVYNFNNYGILMITAANGALISGNSVYYNSSATPTGDQYGIFLMPSTFNHVVANNYVGGQAPLCQGNAWTVPGAVTFSGIHVEGTNSGPITVSNNIVRNISMTGTGAPNFYGLEIGLGLFNIMNNTIGSETVAGSITYAGTGNVYGLYSNSVNAANTVENNIIGNWSLTAASGSPNVYGMHVFSANAKKNKIFNISASNAALTLTIYGVWTDGLPNLVNEYSNNIISLDAGAALNPVIYGFYTTSYTNVTYKLYYNDIHISGPATVTSSTYAYYSHISSAIEFRNNIIANLRSPGGTGKHYALFAGTSALTSDYNDFYTVAGPLIYYYGTNFTDLAAWIPATGQDAHSISTDPLFVSSTDLHPQQPLLIAGTPVSGITTDYAGITRATVPTMGAYELTQVVTTAATAITQTAATLNGSVNACSQTVVTSFEYGLTTSYGSSVAATPSPVTGNTATGISAALTSLTINTLYHYRAVGTVGATKYYGADISFTLQSTCSEPTAVVATAIGQTSAGIAWTPPASAPASGYDIYYSTSSTPPTISTTPIASVTAGVTAYTMSPLTLGTMYYVWVRSNCGSGNLSMWSTVHYFSTHGIVPTEITVPGTYPNLTGVGGAFEAINCGGLNENTTISITADLIEPGTIALNGWTENPAGSNYTLLIKPDASTLRTISGTLTYSASQPALIRTNGASRFTIDGQAGKYLTFRNTTATPASTAGTIQFNNGSQNCYLKNSTVESNYSAFAYGTVTIGNTGNNSVEISGNDLHDATAGTTGIPGVGIFCNNSLSSLNILNNNIYNFNLIGIYIMSAANGAVISGNSLYYNSPTAPATGQWGIYLLSTAFNHLVTNNYIGGQAPLCQGSAWTYPVNGDFKGIYASGTDAGPITISNNIIRNIAMTSSGTPQFFGIQVLDGLFNIMNNTVGSETVAGSITYAGTENVYGLFLNSVNPANAVENNIFGNWSLTAASGSPWVYGMRVYSVNARKNKILNISASNAALTPVIYGVWSRGAQNNVNEYSNNIISLDAGSASNPLIYGFYGNAWSSNTTFKFYYNDIHISGPSTATSSTYAFYNRYPSSLEYKNNTFSNLRSSGGTGWHYAIFIDETLVMTSDYNDFYSVAGPLAYYNSADRSNLAAWQSATSQDAHSISTDPLFVSSTDLHPQQPLLIAGTPITGITTDYAGITRATIPTMGAYELTQVVTTAATSVTQTGATLNGTVNACSQTVVTSFEYGLTTSYGSNDAATPSPVTGTTSTAISASLPGLSPGTLYHFRAVGTVGSTKYYGADLTFTLLPPCSAPTAVTATAICQTSASIAWTPPASAPASGYDIYYSTSSTPPTISTTPTASVAAGVTAYTMTPLTLGTTYFVWVRSNCGSGDLSMWSTVYSFSTHSPVPTAATVPGTYPNLTGTGGAFEAINCDGLNGNTTISITADLTEPGTIALNGWTENPSGSNYTLLIKPDASTLRTISSTLTWSASLPALIRTNGASRFTIDGEAGKYLTFRNTTATPSGTAGTILFNNSSQNCYLKNSTIENNCSSTSYGTVTIGNTGNNSVEISGNDVRDATAGTTGIPGVGIYCASPTSSLSILNNNVYNFNSYGILMITAANGAVISGNSIFYNSPTAPTGSQYGIYLMPSTFNHLINGNYIGGQAPLCQGNAWTYPGTGSFAGIYASGPYAGLITISNNIIRNIAMTSSGTSNFYGLKTGTGLFSIKNNTVGSESVAGSVTYAGTGEVYGLYFTSTNSSNAVENNIFGNWSLTAATGNPVVCGMLVYSVNAVKNKIFNISASNATLTPKIYGIWGLGANGDVNEYSNNIISLDAGAATNPVIYGFYNEAYYNSALKFYYNDIHISGPPTGSSSTYIIYSCSDKLIEYKNNIFSNLRSPGGTGKHYVLYTCGWTTPLSSDYNDFYTVAGPLIYYDGYDLSNLAAWQNISGQDPHSLSIDPLFVSSSDLHPLQPLLVAGTPVTGITTDYAGITRATVPTIGAYEMPQVTTLAATSVTQTAAILNGQVNACSQTVVTSFEYGLTTSYGSSVAATPSPVTGNTATGITAALTGLTINTRYHYRAVGTVGATKYYGADFTFDLEPLCNAPTAVAATAIGQTSASIAWTPPASAPISGYDIYYSTSSTPPTISTTPTASVAAGVTAYTMTPLTLGTTYYVWVRSNCGSGYLSLWSTVYSFSTHGILPTAFTVPGTYPSLTGVGGAFEAINAGGLNGNTTISITADLTEPGTYALNGWTENIPLSTSTLLIKPDASTLRTISGTLTYSASTPALIRTNGASRFTIDGQAGKYLTFRNTTATPASTAGTIQFNNGSQNCYLKNSTLENNYNSTYYGTVTIGNTGSNSVEISGNDIRNATAGTIGIPAVGIYSASQTNSLSILNNNVYNFNSYGILMVAAANGAVISGNSVFYNSSTAPSGEQYGIYFMDITFNHLITNNYVGGQAPLCQGNAWTYPGTGIFAGIYSEGTNAGARTLSNNIIRNIALTSSGAPNFYGLKIGGGLFNIMNNTVGSESVAGSITYAGTGKVYGLYLASVNQSNAVENNIFGNWALTAATGTPEICGIYVYSMNARRNKIFNISASNAALTPDIKGIWCQSLDVGTNEYSNNIISLDGGAATNPYIKGFLNDGNSYGMFFNFYYNDIHISGPPTEGAYTFAFMFPTHNTVELKNNIFSNLRSPGGTGKHYAIYVGNQTPMNSDYNDFYSVAGPLANYNYTDRSNLAEWKAATGQDAHSISTDPLFVSSSDLHPRQPLLVAGTPVTGITTDYAGITRATIPTIGAYEMPQVVTTAASAVTQTGATLNGTVNACSQNVVTSFDYGLTTAYGSSVVANPSPVTGNTATSITAALTGLTINTLYHYRAVGTVGTSNYYGADITFDLVPTPSITSGPTIVCAGVPGNVYTTQSGKSNYAWTVVGGTVTAGGTSTSNTVTITWNTAGLQSVSVNYQNSAGISAPSPAVYGVTVNPLPVPTITGLADVCAGSTGVVYATESGMTGYAWTVSSGGTITAGAGTNQITVTWNTVGSQNVYVNYVNSNGCTATTPTAKAVTVNPLPVPTITGAASVCAGTTGVTYSTEAAMTGYTWTVSAGGSITAGSGTNSITVTWNTAGAQNVYINYVNSNGCTATTPTAKAVTVNPLPVPTITGLAGVCTGSTGVIYATESGMTGYTWTVSAGGTITAGAGTNQITVTWNTVGSQNVYINYVNSNGCTATTPTAKTVTVNPLPVPTITGSAAVCAGSTGVIYATESGMTGYTWTVSAGGSITAGTGTNAITVTWNIAGAQNVYVNYVNSNGCTATTTTAKAVTVNPLPAPTITGSATVCAGSTGVIYATESGMTGYDWTVSAGGSITAGSGTNSITVTWNTAGAQNVYVNYVNSNGCTAATPSVKNVTVNPLPVPTITGSTSLCVNSGYYAYMTEASMNGYVWTLSAGGTLVTGAGTNHISVIWNTPGAQSVSVTYTNLAGCVPASPTTLNVAVIPIPGGAGNITGATALCSGTEGVPYSTPPIADAVTYVWTLPAGASIATGAGTNVITVNFATNASSGNISVYGNNLCGNGTASSVQVTLTPLVAAAGVIAGQPAVCQGASGVVYTVAPIANATEYLWTTPPGTTIVGGAGTNLISVDFDMNAVSGVITVYGSNSCGNGAVSPDFNVTVNPIPATPVVTSSSDILMSSSPTGNQWHFNGIHISGATGQTYVAGITGWYWTDVTLNGCISDTSNHVYMLITGVEEISESQFVVYPVPNGGIFTASITSPVHQSFNILIYNYIGQVIWKMTNIRVSGRFDQQIDLRPIPSGIYTVVLRNDEGVVTRKILIFGLY